MGIVFTAIAVVLFVAAAVLAYKAQKSGTPAATTDLSGPQGKTVIRLLVAGLIALVVSDFVDYVTPTDQLLGFSLEAGLIIVMTACFIAAGRIARKIRAAATAPGLEKNNY